MCATYKDVIVKIVIVAFRQNVRDKVHFIWKLTNDCLKNVWHKKNRTKSMQIDLLHFGFVAKSEHVFFHWILAVPENKERNDNYSPQIMPGQYILNAFR